ncbi:MAG: hypothetical protein UT32_C0018G0017 [Parcubacteria group bacterium GW2011_GWC2_39_14]|nr:MAG: hypothetical protein UT32_C0018G0017 [Parcubacteria group bacterium GW2011_GWC2_39_14]KKR54724.1 MAG: hypothetical protein UT91_C0010G0017 [Parcubacteria group bacterium GW2011_GWA2_40_23]
MRLSNLQKYILRACFNAKGYRLNREVLLGFYDLTAKSKKELRAKIITQSIESLIDRELLVGYGLRTPHKWFITEIKLTEVGLKKTKKLLGEQLVLPLKK